MTGCPVVHTPEYTVCYEWTGHIMLVHVTVRKWSARIARNFRCDIDLAHSLIGIPVYVVVPPDLPNVPKFLERHGFVPNGTVINTHGQTVPFFVRYPPDGRQHHHHVE